MVCRVELRGAFIFDVEPIFPAPRQWRCITPENAVEQRQASSWETLRKNWKAAGFLDEPPWLGLIQEMTCFSHSSFAIPSRSSLSHQASTENNMSGDTDGAWTNFMIHKLLSARSSLASSTISPLYRVQESIRLGCLLYMVPVWKFFGVAPVVPDALLASLQSVLEEDPAESWGQLWMMELWVLYMGATEALDGPLEAWFVGRLVFCCQTNSIQTWADLVDIVQGILWFACLFDRKHRQLVERIQSRL